MGVKASLIEDKENGTISLQLYGEKTGATDGKFTVNDGSAANLDNVDKEAQNAQYSVNGVNYSSQSNDVNLSNGVTATLNKTGSTQITYSANTDKAVDSVKKFVDTFNSLKDAASGSSALTKQLTELASNYGRALGDSGIGIDSNGKMAVTDENKLKQSVSDGSFAKDFQGSNSFGAKLNNVAQNAYRTAYNSAVQTNFNDLMKGSSNASTSARDLLMNNLNSSAGMILNMLV